MTNNNSFLIPMPPEPVLEDVFCPMVGWTVSRDGFCYDCGATDHETEKDMADNAPLPESTYRDAWEG